MSKILAGVAFTLWATASPVGAQSLIGDRGASCAAIPQGGGTHVITLTGPVPRDSTLLIAAGTTGNATYVNTTDSAGNSWVPSYSLAPGFRAFHIYGRISNALSAGQAITISYSAAAPGGETSCASVVAFRGITVTPFPPPVDTIGGASNVSNAPSASLFSFTTRPNDVLHAAFVINAPPGGIGVPPPSTPLQLVCSGTGTFCVMPAYRIAATPGGYTMSATLGNSVPWAAIITGYFSDVIFTDGFD
jgi:hypothetical protein